MEAIRFKPQSESRFVSNPIAPGVGQINSGILTLSGSIHSRNLTITSIHKVGQTIPGIPGSDDSRNKWVRLFPEYMGELIPGIGGSEVSGIFSEEHQQRQGTPKKARCSLEYVMSLFIQFVHLLYSFILFILLFQLACPPLSARLLVKNTNKGENMLCLCSLNFLSVILFNLVCW
jgi:hypothetical protein